MEEIKSLITSPAWWFSIVLMTSVVTLITRKLAVMIDNHFDKRSKLKSKRRKMYEIERNKKLEPIINSEPLQRRIIILADSWASQGTILLIGTLFTLLSLAIMRLESRLLLIENPNTIPSTILWITTIFMFLSSVLLLKISGYKRKQVIDALDKVIDRNNE